MSSAYVHTKLYGGQQGSLFNDLFVNDNKGYYLLNDKNQDALDLTHPIQKFQIYASDVVEGIAITYQFVNKANATLAHGSTTSLTPIVVQLSTTEIVVGIFGRAGLQKAYGLELINSIGFVVYDTSSNTTKVYGPYGNSNKSNEGTTFYVSDVVAFGGFSTDTAKSRGLAGLSFYKQFGGQ